MTEFFKNIYKNLTSKRSEEHERNFDLSKKEDRAIAIKRAVEKTVEEYGPALKKLGDE